MTEKQKAVIAASIKMREIQIEGQKWVTVATYSSDNDEWKRRAEECRQGIIAWEAAVDALLREESAE